MTNPAPATVIPPRHSLRTLLPLTVLTTLIASLTAVLVQSRLTSQLNAAAPLWEISVDKLPAPPAVLPPWGELQRIPMVTEKPDEFSIPIPGRGDDRVDIHR